jgi:hypothetical protein
MSSSAEVLAAGLEQGSGADFVQGHLGCAAVGVTQGHHQFGHPVVGGGDAHVADHGPAHTLSGAGGSMKMTSLGRMGLPSRDEPAGGAGAHEDVQVQALQRLHGLLAGNVLQLPGGDAVPGVVVPRQHGGADFGKCGGGHGSSPTL